MVQLEKWAGRRANRIPTPAQAFRKRRVPKIYLHEEKMVLTNPDVLWDHPALLA
jgi:hypothetical protein